jgi:hypothetical protein
MQDTRVKIAMSLTVVFLILSTSGLLFLIYYKTLAQTTPPLQPTGYFVEVEKLNVPLDITENPIGTFVVYAKDGTTVIWRENVKLSTYKNDKQLEEALDRWASPYIKKYEKKETLSNLAKTSEIIGQKLEHKE